MFQITDPTPVPASGPGALSGFESRCSCGLVLRSSLLQALRNDVADHVRYHEAKSIAGCKRTSFDPLWCETHRAAFADDQPSCQSIRFPRY